MKKIVAITLALLVIAVFLGAGSFYLSGEDNFVLSEVSVTAGMPHYEVASFCEPSDPGCNEGP